MDPRRNPLVITLSIWSGYGYYLTVESAGHGVYSQYWVPEKYLKPVLDSIGAQLVQLEPMTGAHIRISDEAEKPAKEPPSGPV